MVHTEHWDFYICNLMVVKLKLSNLGCKIVSHTRVTGVWTNKRQYLRIYRQAQKMWSQLYCCNFLPLLTSSVW